MSSIYGFDIPHDEGEPCRDYVAIQIPYPPSKVRGLWIPDVARDMGVHSVQAGIIRQMGPLAFKYKDNEGLTKHRVEIGDWVLIRWGAGTMFTAGRGMLNAVGGWRYVTSFNDIIKIFPARVMPDPATLEWTDEGIVDDISQLVAKPDVPLGLDAGVRERTVYGVGNGQRP
jgi:hypothetical protein